MIGPSSSHTAGANRIARLARNFAKLLISRSVKINVIEVEMLNSFSTTGEGHCSDRAIAAGLLGLMQYSSLLPLVWKDPGKNKDNLIYNKSEIEELSKKVSEEKREIKKFSSELGYIKINKEEIKIDYKWVEPKDATIHNNSIDLIFIKTKQKGHLITYSLHALGEEEMFR